LLKREMELFGSLVIGAARATAVPAGSALAVDRDRFAALVTASLAEHPLIEVRRTEVTSIAAWREEAREAEPEGNARGAGRGPPEPCGGSELVIATGPLTSDAMSHALQELLGSEYLYFYDAIAPIVEGESLDLSQLFWQSRYGKGEGDDYLNAPLDKARYLA